MLSGRVFIRLFWTFKLVRLTSLKMASGNLYKRLFLRFNSLSSKVNKAAGNSLMEPSDSSRTLRFLLSRVKSTLDISVRMRLSGPTECISLICF